MNSTSCIAVILLVTAMHLLICSCSEEKKATAPAIDEKDSLKRPLSKLTQDILKELNII